MYYLRAIAAPRGIYESHGFISTNLHTSTTLVIGALQLVDMLLSKLPLLYKPSFRREGVFLEIELLGEGTLAAAKTKDKDRLFAVWLISSPHTSDKDYSEALWELAALFESPPQFPASN